jgi:hypothetical protein
VILRKAKRDEVEVYLRWLVRPHVAQVGSDELCKEHTVSGRGKRGQ